MNELPIEIIQKIAILLSVREYLEFRTLSRRLRSLDQFPYVDFARYKELSLEVDQNRMIESGMPTFLPFKLQRGDLTDSQFLFLARHGHQEQFLRSLSLGDWKQVSQGVKQRAFNNLLTSSLAGGDMMLALLADSNLNTTSYYYSESHEHEIEGDLIHWAAEHGGPKLMEHLLNDDHYDVCILNQDGMNAMQLGIVNVGCQLLKMLLQDGRIDPNSRCYDGNTSMFYAVANNIECCVRLLLGDTRVGPNDLISGDATALDIACWGEHLDCLKVLLQDPRVDLD
jgi:Ankyrin repeats (3 copies)